MVTDLPITMNAAQWSSNAGGIEKNVKLNSSTPLPKTAASLPKHSTVVKVAYSTLNPVDYKLPEMPIVGKFFSKPAIPCSDFAGTVVSSTLPHLKPGELVCGKVDPPTCGALGEYAVVSDTQGIVPVPNGVGLKDAAGVGICGLTAYQSIVPCVKKGDKVFINGGSGGTGTYGIQIAKAIGCSVTATCSGANVELCKNLGADEVIDYRTNDVVEYLKRQGTQYDLLVDNVNMPAIYWDAQHYLKPTGIYITISGDVSLANIRSMMSIFLLPKFLGGGQRTPKFLMCKSNAIQYAEILGWMKEGKVKTVVEQEFGLDRVGEAFARLKSGRTRGKLVIKVAGD